MSVMTAPSTLLHPARKGPRPFTAEDLWAIPRVGAPVPSPDGRAVAVVPFIGELDEGMSGGSTPQDLELMFQLLYLRFTRPRADPTAFAAFDGIRRANIVFAAALSPEQRAKKVTHPERGVIDVEDLLVTLAGHGVHHLKQFKTY